MQLGSVLMFVFTLCQLEHKWVKNIVDDNWQETVTRYKEVLVCQLDTAIFKENLNAKNECKYRPDYRNFIWAINNRPFYHSIQHNIDFRVKYEGKHN